jgi:hypothetical protein
MYNTYPKIHIRLAKSSSFLYPFCLQVEECQNLLLLSCLCQSQGGVSLKVMPPAILGGPHEHAGPPPRTLGGPEGFPVRSSITFPRVFRLVCVGCALNLPPTLLLVAKLVLAFFLVYLVLAPVPLVLFSPRFGAVDVVLAPVPLVLFSPLLGAVDVVLVPSHLALTLFRPRPLVGTVGLSVDGAVDIGALDVGALEWPTDGALEDSPN